MPVFDFSDTPKKEEEPQCTYTVYYSNEPAASPEKPMLVLDNSSRDWRHHSCGVFTNQAKRTAFEFKEEDGTVSADILQVDARFTSLLRWLGENHISVRLSGQNRGDGYAVYKIREVAFGGGTKLSAEDGFLQFMIERLLAGSAPEPELAEEDQEENGDDMKLTSIQSLTDFMNCAGRTLPDNIRIWARRNLAVARSHEVTPEERRHAQRALSIMMNIQWKNHYFESIDPVEARRILDEELYGMERVKQRIIETIIQINRTHTLPAGGVYPIATANDKSQISAPLMSRFAVIDIPDYTPEEKKIIFSKYAMPKVLKRMGLHENECVVTEDALDAVIEKYADTTGIRDLEQAAEHMAANALYQIEVDNVAAVVFDGDMVRELLG